MMLFEQVRKNESAVRQVGARAIDAARRAGVAAYYMDPSLGEGIIKEMPDGSRHRLKPGTTDEVVESFGPRA
ncbi:hypothetical protein [Methylobacterium aerolatum]|uniref:Fe-Mo cluster-binding NifX family protein n=1 Tax=Methylobacterium aerolatum TaxID=418708 RepID=A0ABU0I509_9HYPH|nr:hypothetical protein [Methylobacterium aerolatum]MDQ0449708.1 putative Fe-Mo cluster-binding NifX family protein [Methylobacterium aerolatum]GJD37185.1 hypothetical protein FMGBMHLM_4111 [Methylobacterium aerolatum]